MRNNIYLILAMCSLGVAVACSRNSLYVSVDGNDSRSGNAMCPFGTLERAVREIGAMATADTVVVNIGSGKYMLDRPIDISSKPEGTVVFRGDKDDKPVLIGGVQISCWEKCEGNLYRAYVPEVLKYGYSFEQFYVNGKRAVEACTPDNDWFFVKGSEETVHVPGGSVASYSTQKIILDKNDLDGMASVSDKDRNDIRFRFYHKWDITQKKAEYLDLDKAALYIDGRGMKPWNPIKEGSRYVMRGYKGALTKPGEWYLDRTSGYVYYMPEEGEDICSAMCFAPGLEQWIRIHGSEKSNIKDIRFENIVFSCTSYRMPESGENPMQAAASITAGADVEYAENIVFENCEFIHTGGYAVSLGKACRNCTIEHCYLADLGAGGIKIGSTSYPKNDGERCMSNKVRNCIITHGGLELPCGVGVAVFHSSDNEITHNDISDLMYSGVSVGWTWGYNNNGRVSPAVRNTVSYNHIHHIGWGELSDMGAVYTLGVSPGTKVVHNVIHDILSYSYGGWGLYTDEGSTDVEMMYNLVYRCKSGGFHQHYGENNRIENNIFAFGHYYQLQYTRVEPHLSFHFKRNIILQDKGETFDGPWDTGNIDMESNLYWHTAGVPEFNGCSFDDWRRYKDRNSIIEDPMFIDPVHDNFGFRSLTAVDKIGFEPFDPSEAGVFGDKEWIEKAKLPDETVAEFARVAEMRYGNNSRD